MATMIDQVLKQDLYKQIVMIVAQSENRGDLWKLCDEIAWEITAFIQGRDAKTMSSFNVVGDTNPKRTRVDLAEKLAISKIVEKPATPKTTGGADVSSGTDFSDSLNDTTQKSALPEKNSTGTITSDGDKSGKNTKNAHALDDLESPRGYFPPLGDGPTWMSENVNLAEYWVYDYSAPCTTNHGKNGKPAAQTEIWLVNRHKYKLLVIDAEFESLGSLRDFLDPRKELAAKNRICPLEKIDAELAGKDEKQRAECRAAKKQSQFSRFIEYYHEFRGDAAKIAAAMGIEKQSVYAYKNKAKSMGVLS